MNHFNELTPSEHERLSLLFEEMAEATQIVGKIMRHGYHSCHPNNLGVTNRSLLEKELGHVRHAMILLCDKEDLSKTNIHAQAKLKAETVRKYLHHTCGL